jgi:hypothetical protein
MVDVDPILASTCEPAGLPLWTEPPSAWSSLAFVVAGAWILAANRYPRRHLDARGGTSASPAQVALGALTVLVGVGSAMQHGPAPPWNPVLHDPPIMGALALVAADAAADLTGRRLRAWWWLTPMAIVVVLAALAPSGAVAAQAATAAIAVALSVRRAGRRPRVQRRTFAALTLLAIGSGAGTMSRPGRPWCVPDGWLDGALSGHAVWHMLAAAAIAVLAPAVGQRGSQAPR